MGSSTERPGEACPLVCGDHPVRLLVTLVGDQDDRYAGGRVELDLVDPGHWGAHMQGNKGAGVVVRT